MGPRFQVPDFHKDGVSPVYEPPHPRVDVESTVLRAGV